MRRTSGPLHARPPTLIYSRFSNFIFQAPTGEIEDDLPVFAIARARPNYYGFELRGRRQARHGARRRLGRRAGRRRGPRDDQGLRPGAANPAAPPARRADRRRAASSTAGSRSSTPFAQSRTAPLETEDAGYTLVNASLEWHPLADKPELTLSLSAATICSTSSRGGTRACSRIMRRSPGATSG